MAHRGRPARATRRVPMCGNLAGAGTIVGELAKGGTVGEIPGQAGNDGERLGKMGDCERDR